ncbi:MAG: PHP domain-containing protein [Promethearchaeia archaeon]
MEIRTFLKKNKRFSVILILFLVWIAILTIFTLTADRTIIFYDWLGMRDVSAQYTSKIPLLRYFLEPIIGLSLVIDGYGILEAMISTLIICRIVTYHFKKKGYLESKKAKLLWYPVKDWLRFTFIVLSVTILSGLLLVLLIYLTIGFLYVNLYWMAVLQIFMFIAIALIIGKAVVIVIKYLHPKLKLHYKNKKRYNLPKARTKRVKYFRIFRREFVYVMGVSLLIAGSGIILQTIRFPMHTIETDLEEDELLLDFHVHTFMSDGWISPEERVDWYIEHGIDGGAFSDHDNLRGAEVASKYVKENNLDFKVFYAQEWTDHENDIHMNIFGLRETIVPLESETEDGPKAMNAEETIQYVKENGGSIMVNHYNYNENPDGGYGMPYSLEQLKNWGVDGFEIVNGGHPKDLRIREFCLNHSLACVGGSDIHENKELNTIAKLKLNNTEDYNITDVFNAMKQNTHEVVGINLNPKEVRLHELFYALELDYIEDFAEYLLNLDSFQLLSWISWSLGFFILFMFLYFKGKNIDLEELKEKIL